MIVTTLGRADELRDLIDSPVVQAEQVSKAVIVDQNNDYKLSVVLAQSYNRTRLRQMRSGARRKLCTRDLCKNLLHNSGCGIQSASQWRTRPHDPSSYPYSAAANRFASAGLVSYEAGSNQAYAGEVINFPDGECINPRQTISRIHTWLPKDNALTVPSIAISGQLKAGWWATENGPITPAVVMICSFSGVTLKLLRFRTLATRYHWNTLRSRLAGCFADTRVP